MRRHLGVQLYAWQYERIQSKMNWPHRKDLLTYRAVIFHSIQQLLEAMSLCICLVLYPDATQLMRGEGIWCHKSKSLG